MKIVFSTDNSLEAHMMKHLLQEQNIGVSVSGEALAGARGELQANSPISLSVDLDGDFERARSIIEEFESRNKIVPEPSSRHNRNMLAYILVAVIFFIFGAGAMYSYFYSPISRDGIDVNGDGKVDIFYTYKNDFLTKNEQDRNFDGKVDAFHEFDRRGLIVTSSFDSDFDGRFEYQLTYENEFNYKAVWDQDGDELPDAVFNYKNDNLESQIIYHEKSRIPAKKISYINGVLDSNGDGVFDKKITYDRLEEPSVIEDIIKD